MYYFREIYILWNDSNVVLVIERGVDKWWYILLKIEIYYIVYE